MALTDSQIRAIARLTFQAPYSYSQLSKLIGSSYQEVKTFFRSKRSKELFISCRPWLEILDTCNPELSQGRKKYYRKLIKAPENLVRLKSTGLYLITARAKVKLDFCSGKEPENRIQARAKKARDEKLIFRKLNYSHATLTALKVGTLNPGDLPGLPGSQGRSQKYYDFIHGAREPEESGQPGQLSRGGEGGGSEGGEEPNTKGIKSISVSNLAGEKTDNQENINRKNPVPSSWLLANMMSCFKEEEEGIKNDGYGFFCQEEEELIELPYSQDRLIEMYSRDQWKKFDPFKIGKASPERFKALMKLLKANIKNFGCTIDKKDDKGKRVFIPENQDLKEELIELMESYLERTSNESLILMPKNDLYGEPLLKPNSNRFNNEEKRADARIRFENIFGDAGKKYKSAVMLTLTSGQWHNNIFEDSRAFQGNFNKLITRLRKDRKDQRINDLVQKNPEFLKARMIKNFINLPDDKKNKDGSAHSILKGARKETKVHNKTSSYFRKEAESYIKSDNSLKLPYLCVREFQKNGNIHFHVIIFGVRWLKDNNLISKIWKEYGQGKITHTCRIRYNQERGYIWEPGEEPEDSKGRQPLEYLKKYLLKGQYPEMNPEASLLYWVFNSRFYTYSSSLLSDEHKPRIYVSKNQYVFFGVCSKRFYYDNGELLMCVEEPGGGE